MTRVLRAIAYTGEGSKSGCSLTAGLTSIGNARGRNSNWPETIHEEEAEHWVEQEMLAEAFSHWDEAGRVRRGRAPRRYRWWNAMPLRDLDTERKLCLAEMGFVLDESSGTTRSQTKRKRVGV